MNPGPAERATFDGIENGNPSYPQSAFSGDQQPSSNAQPQHDGQPTSPPQYTQHGTHQQHQGPALDPQQQSIPHPPPSMPLQPPQQQQQVPVQQHPQPHPQQHPSAQQALPPLQQKPPPTAAPVDVTPLDPSVTPNLFDPLFYMRFHNLPSIDPRQGLLPQYSQQVPHYLISNRVPRHMPDLSHECLSQFRRLEQIYSLDANDPSQLQQINDFKQFPYIYPLLRPASAAERLTYLQNIIDNVDIFHIEQANDHLQLLIPTLLYILVHQTAPQTYNNETQLLRATTLNAINLLPLNSASRQFSFDVIRVCVGIMLHDNTVTATSALRVLQDSFRQLHNNNDTRDIVIIVLRGILQCFKYVDIALDYNFNPNYPSYIERNEVAEQSSITDWKHIGPTASSTVPTRIELPTDVNNDPNGDKFPPLPPSARDAPSPSVDAAGQPPSQEPTASQSASNVRNGSRYADARDGILTPSHFSFKFLADLLPLLHTGLSFFYAISPTESEQVLQTVTIYLLRCTRFPIPHNLQNPTVPFPDTSTRSVDSILCDDAILRADPTAFNYHTLEPFYATEYQALLQFQCKVLTFIKFQLQQQLQYKKQQQQQQQQQGQSEAASSPTSVFGIQRFEGHLDIYVLSVIQVIQYCPSSLAHIRSELFRVLRYLLSSPFSNVVTRYFHHMINESFLFGDQPSLLLSPNTNVNIIFFLLDVVNASRPMISKTLESINAILKDNHALQEAYQVERIKYHEEKALYDKKLDEYQTLVANIRANNPTEQVPPPPEPPAVPVAPPPMTPPDPSMIVTPVLSFHSIVNIITYLLQFVNDHDVPPLPLLQSIKSIILCLELGNIVLPYYRRYARIYFQATSSHMEQIQLQYDATIRNISMVVLSTFTHRIEWIASIAPSFLATIFHHLTSQTETTNNVFINASTLPLMNQPHLGGSNNTPTGDGSSSHPDGSQTLPYHLNRFFDVYANSRGGVYSCRNSDNPNETIYHHVDHSSRFGQFTGLDQRNRKALQRKLHKEGADEGSGMHDGHTPRVSSTTSQTEGDGDDDISSADLLIHPIPMNYRPLPEHFGLADQDVVAFPGVESGIVINHYQAILELQGLLFMLVEATSSCFYGSHRYQTTIASDRRLNISIFQNDVLLLNGFEAQCKENPHLTPEQVKTYRHNTVVRTHVLLMPEEMGLLKRTIRGIIDATIVLTTYIAPSTTEEFPDISPLSGLTNTVTADDRIIELTRFITQLTIPLDHNCLCPLFADLVPHLFDAIIDHRSVPLINVIITLLPQTTVKDSAPGEPSGSQSANGTTPFGVTIESPSALPLSHPLHASHSHHASTTVPFLSTLLSFVTSKLYLLDSPIRHSRVAYILFRIIKLILNCVHMNVDLEPVLQPYILPIIFTCIRSASVSATPLTFLNILLLIFRYTSSGTWKLIFIEISTNSVQISEALMNLYNDVPIARELCLELFLHFPLHVSTLPLVLPFILRAIILAMELPAYVESATIAFCNWLDVLQAEFLMPFIHPHLPHLIRVLCSMITPSVSSSISIRVAQILGRLGGRSRTFSSAPLELTATPALGLDSPIHNNVMRPFSFNADHVYQLKISLYPHHAIQINLGTVLSTLAQCLVDFHSSRVSLSLLFNTSDMLSAHQNHLKKQAFTLLRSAVVSIFQLRNFSNPTTNPWFLINRIHNIKNSKSPKISSPPSLQKTDSQADPHTVLTNEHGDNNGTDGEDMSSMHYKDYEEMQLDSVVSGHVNIPNIIANAVFEEQHTLLRDIAMLIDTVNSYKQYVVQTKTNKITTTGNGPRAQDEVPLYFDRSVSILPEVSSLITPSTAYKEIRVPPPDHPEQVLKTIHRHGILRAPLSSVPPPPHSLISPVPKLEEVSSTPPFSIHDRLHELLYGKDLQRANLESRAGAKGLSYSSEGGHGEALSLSMLRCPTHPFTPCNCKHSQDLYTDDTIIARDQLMLTYRQQAAESEVLFSNLFSALFAAGCDHQLSETHDCDAAATALAITRHIALLFTVRDYNREMLAYISDEYQSGLRNGASPQGIAATAKPILRDFQHLYAQHSDVIRAHQEMAFVDGDRDKNAALLPAALPAAPSILSLSALTVDSTTVDHGFTVWLAPLVYIQTLVANIGHLNPEISNSALFHCRHLIHTLTILLGTDRLVMNDCIIALKNLAISCLGDSSARIKFAGISVLHMLVYNLPRSFPKTHAIEMLKGLLTATSDSQHHLSVTITALAQTMAKDLVTWVVLDAKQLTILERRRLQLDQHLSLSTVNSRIHNGQMVTIYEMGNDDIEWTLVNRYIDLNLGNAPHLSAAFKSLVYLTHERDESMIKKFEQQQSELAAELSMDDQLDIEHDIPPSSMREISSYAASQQRQFPRVGPPHAALSEMPNSAIFVSPLHTTLLTVTTALYLFVLHPATSTHATVRTLFHLLSELSQIPLASLVGIVSPAVILPLKSIATTEVLPLTTRIGLFNGVVFCLESASVSISSVIDSSNLLQDALQNVVVDALDTHRIATLGLSQHIPCNSFVNPLDQIQYFRNTHSCYDYVVSHNLQSIHDLYDPIFGCLCVREELTKSTSSFSALLEPLLLSHFPLETIYNVGTAQIRHNLDGGYGYCNVHPQKMAIIREPDQSDRLPQCTCPTRFQVLTRFVSSLDQNEILFSAAANVFACTHFEQSPGYQESTFDYLPYVYSPLVEPPSIWQSSLSTSPPARTATQSDDLSQHGNGDAEGTAARQPSVPGHPHHKNYSTNTGEPRIQNPVFYPNNMSNNYHHSNYTFKPHQSSSVINLNSYYTAILRNRLQQHHVRHSHTAFVPFTTASESSQRHRLHASANGAEDTATISGTTSTSTMQTMQQFTTSNPLLRSLNPVAELLPTPASEIRPAPLIQNNKVSAWSLTVLGYFASAHTRLRVASMRLLLALFRLPQLSKISDAFKNIHALQTAAAAAAAASSQETPPAYDVTRTSPVDPVYGLRVTIIRALFLAVASNISDVSQTAADCIQIIRKEFPITRPLFQTTVGPLLSQCEGLLSNSSLSLNAVHFIHYFVQQHPSAFNDKLTKFFLGYLRHFTDPLKLYLLRQSQRRASAIYVETNLQGTLFDFSSYNYKAPSLRTLQKKPPPIKTGGDTTSKPTIAPTNPYNPHFTHFAPYFDSLQRYIASLISSHDDIAFVRAIIALLSDLSFDPQSGVRVLEIVCSMVLTIEQYSTYLRADTNSLEFFTSPLSMNIQRDGACQHSSSSSPFRTTLYSYISRYPHEIIEALCPYLVYGDEIMTRTESYFRTSSSNPPYNTRRAPTHQVEQSTSPLNSERQPSPQPAEGVEPSPSTSASGLDDMDGEAITPVPLDLRHASLRTSSGPKPETSKSSVDSFYAQFNFSLLPPDIVRAFFSDIISSPECSSIRVALMQHFNGNLQKYLSIPTEIAHINAAEPTKKHHTLTIPGHRDAHGTVFLGQPLVVATPDTMPQFAHSQSEDGNMDDSTTLNEPKRIFATPTHQELSRRSLTIKFLSILTFYHPEWLITKPGTYIHLDGTMSYSGDHVNIVNPRYGTGHANSVHEASPTTPNAQQLEQHIPPGSLLEAIVQAIPTILYTSHNSHQLTSPTFELYITSTIHHLLLLLIRAYQENDRYVSLLWYIAAIASSRPAINLSIVRHFFHSVVSTSTPTRLAMILESFVKNYKTNTIYPALLHLAVPRIAIKNRTSSAVGPSYDYLREMCRQPSFLLQFQRVYMLNTIIIPAFRRLASSALHSQASTISLSSGNIISYNYNGNGILVNSLDPTMRPSGSSSCERAIGEYNSLAPSPAPLSATTPVVPNLLPSHPLIDPLGLFASSTALLIATEQSRNRIQLQYQYEDLHRPTYPFRVKHRPDEGGMDDGDEPPAETACTPHNNTLRDVVVYEKVDQYPFARDKLSLPPETIASMNRTAAHNPTAASYLPSKSHAMNTFPYNGTTLTGAYAFRNAPIILRAPFDYNRHSAPVTHSHSLTHVVINSKSGVVKTRFKTHPMKVMSNPSLNPYHDGRLFTVEEIRSAISISTLSSFIALVLESDELFAHIRRTASDPVPDQMPYVKSPQPKNYLFNLLGHHFATAVLRTITAFLETVDINVSSHLHSVIVKYMWEYVKFPVEIPKVAGYIALARFIDLYQIETSVIQQIFFSIVHDYQNVHNPLNRLLLQRASELLFVMLPKRVCYVERRSPPWVRWIKKCLLDDCSLSPDTVWLVLNIIVRQPALFYASRMYLQQSLALLIARTMASVTAATPQFQLQTLLDLFDTIVSFDEVAHIDTTRCIYMSQVQPRLKLSPKIPPHLSREEVKKAIQEKRGFIDFIGQGNFIMYEDTGMSSSEIHAHQLALQPLYPASDTQLEELIDNLYQGTYPSRSILDSITSSPPTSFTIQYAQSSIKTQNDQYKISMISAIIITNGLIKIAITMSTVDSGRALAKRATSILHRALTLWSGLIDSVNFSYFSRYIEQDRFKNAPQSGEFALVLTYSLDLLNVLVSHLPPELLVPEMKLFLKIIGLSINLTSDRAKSVAASLVDKLTTIFPPYAFKTVLPAALNNPSITVSSSNQDQVSEDGLIIPARTPSTTCPPWNPGLPQSVRDFYQEFQQMLRKSLDAYDRTSFSSVINIIFVIVQKYPAFIDWDELFCYLVKTVIRISRDHRYWLKTQEYPPLNAPAPQSHIHTDTINQIFPKLLYVIGRRRTPMPTESKRSYIRSLCYILDESTHPLMFAIVADYFYSWILSQCPSTTSHLDGVGSGSLDDNRLQSHPQSSVYRHFPAPLTSSEARHHYTYLDRIHGQQLTMASSSHMLNNSFRFPTELSTNFFPVMHSLFPHAAHNTPTSRHYISHFPYYNYSSYTATMEHLPKYAQCTPVHHQLSFIRVDTALEGCDQAGNVTYTISFGSTQEQYPYMSPVHAPYASVPRIPSWQFSKMLPRDIVVLISKLSRVHQTQLGDYNIVQFHRALYQLVMFFEVNYIQQNVASKLQGYFTFAHQALAKASYYDAMQKAHQQEKNKTTSSAGGPNRAKASLPVPTLPNTTVPRVQHLSKTIKKTNVQHLPYQDAGEPVTYKGLLPQTIFDADYDTTNPMFIGAQFSPLVTKQTYNPINGQISSSSSSSSAAQHIQQQHQNYMLTSGQATGQVNPTTGVFHTFPLLLHIRPEFLKDLHQFIVLGTSSFIPYISYAYFELYDNTISRTAFDRLNFIFNIHLDSGDTANKQPSLNIYLSQNIPFVSAMLLGLLDDSPLAPGAPSWDTAKLPPLTSTITLSEYGQRILASQQFKRQLIDHASVMSGTEPNKAGDTMNDANPTASGVDTSAELTHSLAEEWSDILSKDKDTASNWHSYSQSALGEDSLDDGDMVFPELRKDTVLYQFLSSQPRVLEFYEKYITLMYSSHEYFVTQPSHSTLSSFLSNPNPRMDKLHVMDPLGQSMTYNPTSLAQRPFTTLNDYCRFVIQRTSQASLPLLAPNSDIQTLLDGASVPRNPPPLGSLLTQQFESTMPGEILALQSPLYLRAYDYTSAASWKKQLITAALADSQVAYHLYVELFPHIWKLLTATERSIIARYIMLFFAREGHRQVQFDRPHAIHMVLAGFVRLLDPDNTGSFLSNVDLLPDSIRPELYRHTAQNYSTWHQSLAILQAMADPMMEIPSYECKDATPVVSTINPPPANNQPLPIPPPSSLASPHLDPPYRLTASDTLAEVYSLLGDQESFLGLWATRVISNDTRLAIVAAQNKMFALSQEYIGQAFTQYTNTESPTITPTNTQSTLVADSSDFVDLTYISPNETSLWADMMIKNMQSLNQWNIASDLASQLGLPELQLEASWRLENWHALNDLYKQYELSNSPKCKIYELYREIVSSCEALCGHVSLPSAAHHPPFVLDTAQPPPMQTGVPPTSSQLDMDFINRNPHLENVCTVKALPPKERLHELLQTNIASFHHHIQEIQLLPRFVGEHHHSLFHRLHRLVEIHESILALHDITAYIDQYHGLMARSQNDTAGAGSDTLKTPHRVNLYDYDVGESIDSGNINKITKLLATWRGRLPSENEDLSLWSDILGWRLMFQTILRDALPMLHPRHSRAIMEYGVTSADFLPPYDSANGTSLRNALVTQHQIHDMSWTILKFSQVARKQGIRDAAIVALSRLTQVSGNEPLFLFDSSVITEIDGLPFTPSGEGFAVTEESDIFPALVEASRNMLGYIGATPSPLSILALLAQADVSQMKTSYQKSEIYLLQAEALTALDRVELADALFERAVAAHPQHGNAWYLWGILHRRIATTAAEAAFTASSQQPPQADPDAVIQALANPNYLRTDKVKLHESYAITCLLMALSHHCDMKFTVLPMILELLYQSEYHSLVDDLQDYSQLLQQYSLDINEFHRKMIYEPASLTIETAATTAEDGNGEAVPVVQDSTPRQPRFPLFARSRTGHEHVYGPILEFFERTPSSTWLCYLPQLCRMFLRYNTTEISTIICSLGYVYPQHTFSVLKPLYSQLKDTVVSINHYLTTLSPLYTSIIRSYTPTCSDYYAHAISRTSLVNDESNPLHHMLDFSRGLSMPDRSSYFRNAQPMNQGNLYDPLTPSSSNQALLKQLEQMITTLSTSNQDVMSCMERIHDEFTRRFKPFPEEELLAGITAQFETCFKTDYRITISDLIPLAICNGLEALVVKFTSLDRDSFNRLASSSYLFPQERMGPRSTELYTPVASASNSSTVFTQRRKTLFYMTYCTPLTMVFTPPTHIVDMRQEITDQLDMIQDKLAEAQEVVVKQTQSVELIQQYLASMGLLLESHNAEIEDTVKELSTVTKHCSLLMDNIYQCRIYLATYESHMAQMNAVQQQLHQFLQNAETASNPEATTTFSLPDGRSVTMSKQQLETQLHAMQSKLPSQADLASLAENQRLSQERFDQLTKRAEELQAQLDRLNPIQTALKERVTAATTIQIQNTFALDESHRLVSFITAQQQSAKESLQRIVVPIEMKVNTADPDRVITRTVPLPQPDHHIPDNGPTTIVTHAVSSLFPRTMTQLIHILRVWKTHLTRVISSPSMTYSTMRKCSSSLADYEGHTLHLFGLSTTQFLQCHNLFSYIPSYVPQVTASNTPTIISQEGKHTSYTDYNGNNTHGLSMPKLNEYYHNILRSLEQHATSDGTSTGGDTSSNSSKSAPGHRLIPHEPVMADYVTHGFSSPVHYSLNALNGLFSTRNRYPFFPPIPSCSPNTWRSPLLSLAHHFLQNTSIMSFPTLYKFGAHVRSMETNGLVRKRISCLDPEGNSHYYYLAMSDIRHVHNAIRTEQAVGFFNALMVYAPASETHTAYDVNSNNSNFLMYVPPSEIISVRTQLVACTPSSVSLQDVYHHWIAMCVKQRHYESKKQLVKSGHAQLLSVAQSRFQTDAYQHGCGSPTQRDVNVASYFTDIELLQSNNPSTLHSAQLHKIFKSDQDALSRTRVHPNDVVSSPPHADKAGNEDVDRDPDSLITKMAHVHSSIPSNVHLLATAALSSISELLSVSTFSADTPLLLHRAYIRAVIGTEDAFASATEETETLTAWYNALLTHPHLPPHMLNMFIYRTITATMPSFRSPSSTMFHSTQLGSCASSITQSQVHLTANVFLHATNTLLSPNQPGDAHLSPASSAALQSTRTHNSHQSNLSVIYEWKRRFAIQTAYFSVFDYICKIPNRFPQRIWFDLDTGNSYHTYNLPLYGTNNALEYPEKELVSIRLTRNITTALPAYAKTGILLTASTRFVLLVNRFPEAIKSFFNVYYRDDLSLFLERLSPQPIACNDSVYLLHKLVEFEPEDLNLSIDELKDKRYMQLEFAHEKVIASKAMVYTRNGSGWAYSTNIYHRLLLLDAFVQKDALYNATAVIRRSYGLLPTSKLPTSESTPEPSAPDFSAAKIDALLQLATSLKQYISANPIWNPIL